jgi:imidazolonepropionase
MVGGSVEADLIVRHAAELVTLAGEVGRPRLGAELRDLSIIEDGALAALNGAIAWVGPTAELDREVTPSPACRTVDASGRIVLPGLVDPHTHLLFAGSREQEFVQRIEGKNYLEIAAAGGGINATVAATRQASKEELKAVARVRLRRMLEMGVTTAEVKSGYGLETATEIKMLEAINELALEEDLPHVVPTFLGAHEVPPEYRGRTADYIQLLVTEMIPEVASRHLARFNDVFCEKGVFSLEESEKVLNAGIFHGLRSKLHADELTPLGGAELAADLKATSADHLLFVTDHGIDAMARARVVAVLLPGTAYFLSLGRYAPARRLIERGVPVALATDCNPGSCMTESLPLVLNMACTQMRLSPAEAISAATFNAAWAVGEAGRVGSLEPGKQADFVILDAPNHLHLCYHFGVNLVQAVFKHGRLAHGHA